MTTREKDSSPSSSSLSDDPIRSRAAVQALREKLRARIYLTLPPLPDLPPFQEPPYQAGHFVQAVRWSDIDDVLARASASPPETQE